jgi:hypothetical protein
MSDILEDLHNDRMQRLVTLSSRQLDSLGQFYNGFRCQTISGALYISFDLTEFVTTASLRETLLRRTAQSN